MIVSGGEIAMEYPALLTIDSLSRFINCSLLINRSSIHAGQVFMNDWARTIGNPRRIFTVRGGPTLSGASWAELSHAFGWEMIHAPQFPSHQNGSDERSTRSLKIAIKNIISATGALGPSQEIVTQAVIAKNHVPHAVTGLPPALVMTGRGDFLPGHGRAAFTHGPEQHDAITRVNNSTSVILNARNAIITADSNYAIKTMLNRKSPGRFMSHFFPGASVQIAMNNSRVGTYRVVSVIDSNLALGRSNRIFKRPKCKTRMIHDFETERFDATAIPAADDHPVNESDIDPLKGANDQSVGSSNDTGINVGVLPPEMSHMDELVGASVKNDASAIQFSQPENDNAYGTLAPRDTYHRILTVKYVDIYGIITCVDHPNLSNHDEKWNSFV